MLSLVHLDTLSVEATVQKAPNGDLIVICTCGGVKEPAIENRVYLFRSVDNGKTWSSKVMLGEENGQANYQTCTAIIDDYIVVFITQHNGNFVDWKNTVLVSKDNGYTFTQENLTLLPNYGFIRSMTKLSNGQILFPYHYYPVSDEQAKICKKNNSIVCECDIPYIENGIFIGNPYGKFEKKIAFICKKENFATIGKSKWGWTEDTVIELEPGHLVMLFRADGKGFLWRVDSFDYGNTWRQPFETDIPNPNNKPQLLKNNKGEIILINTPNNREDYYLRRRFPLQVWVSDDNMQSWYKKINVSNFPGAYSYADGFIDDNGVVNIAFDFNRHDVYFATINIEGENND